MIPRVRTIKTKRKSRRRLNNNRTPDVRDLTLVERFQRLMNHINGQNNGAQRDRFVGLRTAGNSRSRKKRTPVRRNTMRGKWS